MDDAALLSLEISQNKARSAVLGKVPTLMGWIVFKGPDAPLSALFFHNDFTAFMGGFPVVLDGKIIGGFGCSGATWEDGLIARAVLAKLDADLSGVDACLEKLGVPKEKWQQNFHQCFNAIDPLSESHLEAYLIGYIG